MYSLHTEVCSLSIIILRSVSDPPLQNARLD
jgi:hypothetical protein